MAQFLSLNSTVEERRMKDKKTLKTDNATIYQTNENCQVFNGPISGCVFAMPGATVNHTAVQKVTGESNEEKEVHDEIKEEPLRNHIFDDRIFDSNARLSKLRDTIAAAIDMGDATIMYGQPQQVRINPTVQSDWYYIVKAIEEAKVARKFTVAGFIDQMTEWFPMLFPDETKEQWEKYKRRLSKSISDEKSLWRYGKMKEVVTLQEMWAKRKFVRLDQAKMERVYAIAYKGLYTSLTNLKQEIEQEKNS